MCLQKYLLLLCQACDGCEYSPCIAFFKPALLAAAARGGQSKITKLVGYFINDVNVVWLDVHMNHMSGVHVLQGLSDLQQQHHVFCLNTFDTLTQAHLDSETVCSMSSLLYLPHNLQQVSLFGLSFESP